MSKNWTRTILFLIILLGVALRSYQVTWRSLWFDEAFSWRLIQFPWEEMLTRASQDVHPPGYYILLKGWRYVFDSTILSLRSFSITWAAVTIYLAYQFTAKAARSKGAGLLAAALVSVSPFQIQYAWEARMYTLGTAGLLLSMWLLITALRAGRIFYWFLFGLSVAAVAYIHYYALFSIAAQICFAAGYLVFVTRGRPGEIIQSRLFWGLLLALAVALAAYAPWLGTFIEQNSRVRESYWIPEIGGWSIPDTFYRMIMPTSGIPRRQGWWLIVAVLPITMTFAVWLRLIILSSGRRERNNWPADAGWLILLSGIVPFLISIILSLFGRSLYQDRFFVFANIFILIGLAMVVDQLKIRRIKRVMIFVILLGFIMGYVSYWKQLGIQGKPGARAAADFIYSQIKPDEEVMASSPFIYFSILHYAQEKWHATAAPKLFSESGQLAHFAGGPILVQSDVVNADHLGQLNKVWMVDTTGFGSSKLNLPPVWEARVSASFPEVFGYQGDVIVTKYEKSN